MGMVFSEWPDDAVAPNAVSDWRAIPSAIVSDELNRSNVMNAQLQPISRQRRFCGPAATVEIMAGDNLALHHAVARAPHGSVLVVDARAYERNAVWGGILHRAAELCGLAGIIIDGCIRDRADIERSELGCFARGSVPAGPHKGWGGTLNGRIQAGGCAVEAGDLIIADEDGIAVVPKAQAKELLPRCRQRIEMEKQVLDRLAAGESTVDIFELTPSGS